MLWLSYLIYYFAYLTYLISGLSLYHHYLYNIKLAVVVHIPFDKRKYICLENCKVAAGAWLVQYIYKRQSSCQPFKATCHTFLTGELLSHLAYAEHEFQQKKKSVEVLVMDSSCLYSSHGINMQDKVLHFPKSCTFCFISANPIWLRHFYKNVSNFELCGKCWVLLDEGREGQKRKNTFLWMH